MTGAAVPSGRTLTDADVAAIASAVAERLAAPARGPALVDAAEIARRFNVSTDFVYSHADQLGAVRLGDGPRPRIRFDPQLVAEKLTSCSASKGSETRKASSKAKPRKAGTANGQNGPRFLPKGAP